MWPSPLFERPFVAKNAPDGARGAVLWAGVMRESVMRSVGLAALVASVGCVSSVPGPETRGLSDRELILKQELGELPAPSGSCPERSEPNVLENPRAAVRRTALGLAYCMLKEGPPGVVPAATDTVRVHYTGWTVDGHMFDSSESRGEPMELPLDGVIRGWTEGLRLMTPGDKARLWIPGNLGYGRREPGEEAGTPPKGTLIFDIELIAVIRKEPLPTTEPEPAPPREEKPRLAPRRPPDEEG